MRGAAAAAGSASAAGVAGLAGRCGLVRSGGARPLPAPCSSAGQRVDRGPHRLRVLGRRAAAAADDPGPGGEHLRDHLAEVLGSGRVDEVAFDALRQPRVRDDAASHGRRRRPRPDERLQADQRPGAAVDADGVGAGGGQGRRGRLGRRAVVGGQVLAERHLGDDRQVAGAASPPRRPSSRVSSRSKVSNTRRSTPPSRSPSICSRKAARAIPG